MKLSKLKVPFFIIISIIALGAIWIYINKYLYKTKASENVYTVPSSIAADCSKAVEPELNAFIQTVPDNSTIQFQAGGCYGQDRTIVVSQRTNLTIDGNGSTFKRITTSNESISPAPPNSNNANWRIDRGSGVVLKNMTIHGNYVPVPHGTPGQGQYTDHGVSIWGAQNASLLNVNIWNVDGEMVAVDPDIVAAQNPVIGGDYTKVAPSRNITIDHVTGGHAARQCMSSTAVDGLTISNSTMDDCQQTGYDAEIDAPGELNRNIHFINNTITDAYFAPISIPLLSFPGYEGTIGNIEIRGNTALHHDETCYASVFVGTYTNESISGLTISNNNFGTVGDGIIFNATGAQATISGNTITYDNPGNTGCYNPALTPPYSTPVRLNGNTGVVVDNTNTFTGFSNNQDQIGVSGTPLPTSSPTPTALPSATSTPSPTLTTAPSCPELPAPPPNCSYQIVNNNTCPSLVCSSPTSTPTPTIAPSPNSTLLSLNLLLHGLGKGGDSANPNGVGNQNPLRLQRAVTVEVYNASNQLVVSKIGLITYNAAQGNFTGTIDLGPTFSTGTYSVKVKVDQFLKALVRGIQTITQGTTNTLSQTTLITGDMNNDNRIDILDYNILMDCYSDLTPAKNCSDQTKKQSADLTDDGAVNQFDYNLFLRELTNIVGQ